MAAGMRKGKVEAPELQALDDDVLASVAGGVGVFEGCDFSGLFPESDSGDFDYASLENALILACRAT